MKIQMLITADYATVDVATGKVHILGAFTRIGAQQFPHIHNRMAVAVKLAADSLTESTEPRNFELILTDEDGIELFQMTHVVRLPRDEKGNRADAYVMLELNKLEFPHSGVYEFSVFIDGEKIGDTPITLAQL